MARPTTGAAAAPLHADECRPLVAAAASGAVQLHALARGQYPGRRLPRTVLPGLLSAGVWIADRDQSWGLPWHFNEGIEFTFLSRGTLSFAADEATHALRRGDLTVTRPWQRHRVGRPYVTASRLYWLILDVGVRHPHQRWVWPKWIALSPTELGQLNRLLRYSEHPRWRASRAVGQAFEQMMHQVESDSPCYTRMCLAINGLLLSIMDLLGGKAIALDRQLVASERSVMLFLDSIRDRCFEPWTLDEMARSCDLGRSRFSTYCAQITGMTPLAWLHQQRAEQVCELFCAEPGASITQIQNRCGFSSSQYFSYWFRRTHGCTPSDYRRRCNDAASHQTSERRSQLRAPNRWAERTRQDSNL